MMEVDSDQCMEKAEAKNDMTLVVKGNRIKKNINEISVQNGVPSKMPGIKEGIGYFGERNFKPN